MADAQPLIVHWRRRLLSDEGPTSSARLVGCALAKYANGEGGSCYPSQRTLAAAAGCSERAVRYAIRALVSGGWVQVTPEAFRGGDRGQAWRRNRYHLTLPEGAERGAAPMPKGEEQHAAASPEGEERGSGKVRNVVPTTKTYTKNVNNDHFEEMWKLYPRKVGKKAAYRAWTATRRSGVEVETLHRTVSRYAAVCRSQGTEQKFIKHPGTFFGPDEPWQDYLEEPADPHADSLARSAAETAAYKARAGSSE